MLRLTVTIVPEQWDSKNERFIPPKVKTLQLEHSLVSLHKWESKWHKPFFSKVEKTTEETIDYIKCMTLTQNVDDDVYNHLSQQNVDEVVAYIENPMTATTISDNGSKKKSNEIITAEVIYCAMFQHKIPFECRKWHLNQLMTLIRVCDIKTSPPKKMSRAETMRHNAELNARNRERFKSKG